MDPIWPVSAGYSRRHYAGRRTLITAALSLRRILLTRAAQHMTPCGKCGRTLMCLWRRERESGREHLGSDPPSPSRSDGNPMLKMATASGRGGEDTEKTHRSVCQLKEIGRTDQLTCPRRIASHIRREDPFNGRVSPQVGPGQLWSLSPLCGWPAGSHSNWERTYENSDGKIGRQKHDHRISIRIRVNRYFFFFFFKYGFV